MIYASGQLVTMSCSFTVSGILTDPTLVQATVRFGTATATTYNFPTAATADAPLIKDSTGVYHFSFTAASAGTYYYRFQGYTSCQAAEEGAWDCAVSRF